jgi:hypothetical protein
LPIRFIDSLPALKAYRSEEEDFMNENKEWKILQIISAQVGWKAIYCQESINNEVTVYERPVICWALVEGIGEGGLIRTETRGIEQRSDRLVVVEDLIRTETMKENGIDPNQYFLGYDDPEAHRESDYWIKQANNRLKAEKGKKQKQ